MAKNRARYEEALTKGLAYNAGERWREALSAFRVAISEFPREPAPYAGLGESCLGLKQLDKALDCYKLAARYSGGRVTYMQQVADIQERLGQLTDAGRTYLAVGEILLRQRQLNEAIDHWRRAVGLEPNLLSAHRRLAMVYQRQNKTQPAVREYLAIARILQMQGEKQKALQMCMAALRLDPGNEDVRLAVDLIQRGEEAFREQEEEEEQAAAEPGDDGGLVDAVRQMAAIFESEMKSQPQEPAQPPSNDPVDVARRLAQEQLAEEIFRDEEEEDVATGEASLSKLERDALIGQGMDFELRGQVDDAIGCYERAIRGGLRMPAAFYTLGLLYREQGRAEAARRTLQLAARDKAYREAARLALEERV